MVWSLSIKRSKEWTDSFLFWSLVLTKIIVRSLSQPLGSVVLVCLLCCWDGDAVHSHYKNLFQHNQQRHQDTNSCQLHRVISINLTGLNLDHVWDGRESLICSTPSNLTAWISFLIFDNCTSCLYMLFTSNWRAWKINSYNTKQTKE